MQYTLIHTHARKQATAISTQKYRLKRETTTTTTSKGNRMPVCIPYVYNVMCSSIGRPFAISGSSNWTEQFCLNNSWDSFLVSVLICSFDAFASLPFKLRLWLWLWLSRSFPTIASLQTIKRKGDNTPCTSINHLANKFSSIKCTLTQALNETYEATKTEIKSSNKKQDVNNICDSLSSPKSNYSRVRMHISLTERWFVHPFCPTKCPFAFIQNTPTLGWHGHNFQFYACIFGFACMHPNNDRPISTRIYADRQRKKRRIRLIKYKRIKVIHLAINAIHNGMHNFVVVFVAICRLRRRFRFRCRCRRRRHRYCCDTFNAKTVR